MAGLSNIYFQVLTIEQISCNLKFEEASVVVMVVDCFVSESLLAISKIGLNFLSLAASSFVFYDS